MLETKEKQSHLLVKVAGLSLRALLKRDGAREGIERERERKQKTTTHTLKMR